MNDFFFKTNSIAQTMARPYKIDFLLSVQWTLFQTNTVNLEDFAMESFKKKKTCTFNIPLHVSECKNDLSIY